MTLAELTHEDERDRFVATLLGGALGDALGRPFESAPTDISRPRPTSFRPWSGWTGGPKGTFTDDTQLTLLVAEVYRDLGDFDPEVFAKGLVDWLPQGRGVGAATRAAVDRLGRGLPWYLAGEDSAGNGAAMRSAPVGLVRCHEPRRLRLDAVLSAIPTHTHAMAAAGSAAIAAAVAFLVTRPHGSWTPEELIGHVQAAIRSMEYEALAERRDPTEHSTLHDRLGLVLRLLGRPLEAVTSRLYCGGYVLESVPTAFWCFLTSPEDPLDAITNALRAGFDADTTGAMTGNLAGAANGTAAFPQALLTDLEGRDEIQRLGADLWQLAHRSDAQTTASIPSPKEAGEGPPDTDGDDTWYTNPIVFNVDASPENADWLKNPANLPPVDSDEWNQMIRVMGLSREEALNLPVYRRQREQEERRERQRFMIKPDELEHNRNWLKHEPPAESVSEAGAPPVAHAESQPPEAAGTSGSETVTAFRPPRLLRGPRISPTEAMGQAALSLGFAVAESLSGHKVWATLFTGGNFSIRCLGYTEDRDDVLFYAFFPNKVPEKRRAAVGELLSHINYGLTTANFEIDLRDGEVRCKSVAHAEDGLLRTVTIEAAFMDGVSRMDTYIPAIGAVAFGAADPLDALASVARVASELDPHMSRYVRPSDE